MQLSSDTDTVSFWMDDAFISQLEDIASDENSEADLSAKLILELNDEILNPKPQILQPADVVEIDIKPTGEPIYTKKGRPISKENDVEISQDFTAYPNPFDQSIRFNTGNRPGKLYLFDIRGQLLNQLTIGESGANISGHQLTPGVYIAVFIDVINTKQTLRIIKQ